jgi:hypothetical protein
LQLADGCLDAVAFTLSKNPPLHLQRQAAQGRKRRKFCTLILISLYIPQFVNREASDHDPTSHLVCHHSNRAVNQGPRSLLHQAELQSFPTSRGTLRRDALSLFLFVCLNFCPILLSLVGTEPSGSRQPGFYASACPSSQIRIGKAHLTRPVTSCIRAHMQVSDDGYICSRSIAQPLALTVCRGTSSDLLFLV